MRKYNVNKIPKYCVRAVLDLLFSLLYLFGLYSDGFGSCRFTKDGDKVKKESSLSKVTSSRWCSKMALFTTEQSIMIFQMAWAQLHKSMVQSMMDNGAMACVMGMALKATI